MGHVGSYHVISVISGWVVQSLHHQPDTPSYYTNRKNNGGWTKKQSALFRVTPTQPSHRHGRNVTSGVGWGTHFWCWRCWPSFIIKIFFLGSQCSPTRSLRSVQQNHLKTLARSTWLALDFRRAHINVLFLPGAWQINPSTSYDCPNGKPLLTVLQKP